MGTIELIGMEFQSRHGCLDWEKTCDQTFIVDFKAELDLSTAADSDSLEDTVDYGAIYLAIKKEMEISSNLLENVAGRIVKAIAEQFPEIQDFSVSVSKLNPPIGGPAKAARITIDHRK